MNFSLTLETNDATILRAISTAAAMIEYGSDASSDWPRFALTDALTTTAIIVDALEETLDDHAAVGFDLREVVPDNLRERLARRLGVLAAILLAPPPTEAEKAERMASLLSEVDKFLAMGYSPAIIYPPFDDSAEPDGDEDDDLFGDAIPA